MTTWPPVGIAATKHDRLKLQCPLSCRPLFLRSHDFAVSCNRGFISTKMLRQIRLDILCVRVKGLISLKRQAIFHRQTKYQRMFQCVTRKMYRYGPRSWNFTIFHIFRTFHPCSIYCTSQSERSFVQKLRPSSFRPSNLFTLVTVDR